MKKIVTRFAPSPTGTLHIGGLRTALFNYVYSKQNNGLFLVRIEDTDRERSKVEYEKNILDTLSSVGLVPDKKPINQSERNEIYVKAAEKIIESGSAYWCDCSQEELEEMRREQAAAGKKVYARFVKGKGELNKYQHHMIRDMAYFEALFNEMLNDKNATDETLEGLKKGRKTKRMN